LLRCVQVTQCPVWRKGRAKFHSALQPERWLLPEHNNGDSQSEQQLYRLRQHSGGHVAPPSPTDTEQQHARQRLRTHSIESSGKLKISPEQHCDFTAEDLRDLGEIGRGAYGSVSKMVHKPTGQIMAVKRIRSTVDEKEQKQLLMDLDVVMRSSDCPYIVQFYGALFREV
ncbi:Dual specificity mitogen-activated protein kinase kinase 4, partial [Goodea atripinnis]